MRWRRAWAVFRFELGRSLTISRLAGWLLLVMFPVFLVSVVKYYDAQADIQFGQPPVSQQAWGVFLFGLVPEVICLLGLLLWATPLVHAELEGRTWIYVAVRPRGRVSILFGKYAAAVAWTVAAGWVSGSACVWIVQPDRPWLVWRVLLALVVLSCLAYGALYSLIGVLFHQRAMVVAVAYTLLLEFVISMIPALFNKLTISYRLRNLLFDWMDWRKGLDEEIRIFLGEEASWVHLGVLFGITVLLLAAATYVVQRCEYFIAREV